MNKSILLSTLVFSGSLVGALTVSGQSHEYSSDTPSASSSSTSPTPSAHETPAENDTAAENREPSSSPSGEHTLMQEHHGLTNSASQAPSTANPALERQQMLLSSATVVGAAVKNAKGETIGDIQEIMIEPETGKVTYAMVTHNNSWGVGKQKSFAVPWEALKVAFNKTDVVVELEEGKLSLPTHVELSQR
jgi:sporulation protein YlmC with PRC-barrel domain